MGNEAVNTRTSSKINREIRMSSKRTEEWGKGKQLFIQDRSFTHSDSKICDESLNPKYIMKKLKLRKSTNQQWENLCISNGNKISISKKKKKLKYLNKTSY